MSMNERSKIVMNAVEPKYREISKDLYKGHLCTSQDIRINGKTIRKGVDTNCEDRYQTLKPTLEKFKRPFTVLELGAGQGYMSIRIAEEFPEAICVMMDTSDTLRKICNYNTDRNNLIHIKQNIDENTLKNLSLHEHFDVIIWSYLLDHLNKPQKCLEYMANMTNLLIIERTPIRDNSYHFRKEMHQIDFALSRNPQFIFLGRNVYNSDRGSYWGNMYYFKNFSPSHLDRISKNTKNIARGHAEIFSSYHDKKILYKGKRIHYPPGIDQETFKSFGGQYPKKTNASKRLLHCKKELFETKPVELESLQIKSVEAESAEPELEESKPVELEPIRLNSVEAESAEPESVELESKKPETVVELEPEESESDSFPPSLFRFF